MNKRQLALAALLVALVCAGCKDDDPAGPSDAVPAPDFALPDVNATSATYDQTVSPRDYLQKVSAWYFGHAT